VALLPPKPFSGFGCGSSLWCRLAYIPSVQQPPIELTVAGYRVYGRRPPLSAGPASAASREGDS
jgi:hypothetical protein